MRKISIIALILAFTVSNIAYCGPETLRVPLSSTIEQGNSGTSMYHRFNAAGVITEMLQIYRDLDGLRGKKRNNIREKLKRTIRRHRNEAAALFIKLKDDKDSSNANQELIDIIENILHVQSIDVLILERFLNDGGVLTEEAVDIIKALIRAEGIRKDVFGFGSRETFRQRLKKFNITSELVDLIREICLRKKMPTRLKVIMTLMRFNGNQRDTARYLGIRSHGKFESLCNSLHISKTLIEKIKERAEKEKLPSREEIRTALVKSGGSIERAAEFFDSSPYVLRGYIKKREIDIKSLRNEIKQEKAEYLKARKTEVQKALDKKEGLPLVSEALEYEAADIVEFVDTRYEITRERWQGIVDKYKEHVLRMDKLGVEKSCNLYSDIVSLFVEQTLRMKNKGYLQKVGNKDVAEMLGVTISDIRYLLADLGTLIQETKTENPFLTNRRREKGLVFEDIERSDIKILLKYLGPESKSVKPVISKRSLLDYASHAQVMRQAGFTKGRSIHVDYVTAFVRLAKNKAGLDDSSPVTDKEIGKFMGYKEDKYGHINLTAGLKNKITTRILSGWSDPFLLDEREEKVFKAAFLNMQKNIAGKNKYSKEIMKYIIIKELDKVRLFFKREGDVDTADFLERIIHEMTSRSELEKSQKNFTKILDEVKVDSRPKRNGERLDLLFKLLDFVSLDTFDRARLVISDLHALAAADYEVKFLCSILLSIMSGENSRLDGIFGLRENKDLREELIDILKKAGCAKKEALILYFGADNNANRLEFNKLLLENGITPDIINGIKKERKIYLKSRRSEIAKIKAEKGYLDVPLENAILLYDVNDIVSCINIRTRLSKKRWISMLTAYKKHVKEMKDVGIVYGCNIYADIISLFVHEAVKIKQEGLSILVKNVEIAQLVDITNHGIKTNLANLGKMIDQAKTENPFLTNRRREKGLVFEDIERNEIEVILKYLMSGNNNARPVISKELLLNYIIHAQLMRQVGVTKGRSIHVDYVTAFIRLAKKQIASDDASPITNNDIRKHLGYLEDRYGKVGYLQVVKKDIRDRIAAGWTDPFAIDRREDRASSQAFLKIRRSGWQAEISKRIKLVKGLSDKI